MKTSLYDNIFKFSQFKLGTVLSMEKLTSKPY